MIETLYKEGRLSTRQIAKRLQISVYTLYAYLRHRKVPVGVYKKKDVERITNASQKF